MSAELAVQVLTSFLWVVSLLAIVAGGLLIIVTAFSILIFWGAFCFRVGWNAASDITVLWVGSTSKPKDVRWLTSEKERSAR